MTEIHQIIERYENVPAMPNVIVKALAIIKNDNSGINELSDIVSYDQALATRILKLVNSAYYGFPAQITSITKGLALIGMVQGKNIIIATAMKPMLTTVDSKDLWKHSIRCAIACEYLAREYNIMDPSEAFAMGFLHDIGKIILMLANQSACQEIKERVEQFGFDELEQEEKEFGMTHVDIGVELARKWQLPIVLINSIKYHHNPLTSSMPQVAGLVYVADRITQDCDPEPLLQQDIFAQLNLNIADLKSVQSKVIEKSTQLLNALG